MDPDGNRLQNSCSPRHWGHSTMHRVNPVSGTTTTMYVHAQVWCNVQTHTCNVYIHKHHVAIGILW